MYLWTDTVLRAYGRSYRLQGQKTRMWLEFTHELKTSPTPCIPGFWISSPNTRLDIRAHNLFHETSAHLCCLVDVGLCSTHREWPGAYHALAGSPRGDTCDRD